MKGAMSSIKTLPEIRGCSLVEEKEDFVSGVVDEVKVEVRLRKKRDRRSEQFGLGVRASVCSWHDYSTIRSKPENQVRYY